MSTTYRFTVSKPTPCPFSGLHHADGHLLVLDDKSLSFHAPDDKGDPGRQLTEARPLKSDADRAYVKVWLDTAVAEGVLVDESAKPDAPKAAKKDDKPAEPAKAPPPPAK